jgi:hypothetical protein
MGPQSGEIDTTAEMTFEAFKEQFGDSFVLPEAN